ncbi:MAG: ABC transporter substrate-binding protein [Flammeovirgaceae bacterium]
MKYLFSKRRWQYVTSQYIFCLFFTITLAACSSNEETKNKSIAKTAFISVKPSYATGFSIDDYGAYQVLHILQPFNDQADTLSYLLHARGNKKPKAFGHLPAIATPINKLIVQSTTHVAFVAEMNAIDKLVGMTATQFIYNPKARERISTGQIVEVGEGELLNQEQVLTLQPDALMVSGFSASSYHKNYKTLIETGVPVLVNSEWMEQSMLGRTEWIKVFGYLLGNPKLANERFEAIETQYLNYAEMGRAAKEKPLVIGGLPYKGSWSIAGAKSYVAQLLTDAGATWNWANDTSSVSLQMDFESVYPMGLKADYWLRVGGITSKEELLAIDQRLADFKAYQNGNLYNNNKRLTADGLGNDYWESGIVKPHRILGDIIKIIHPDLLPEYELFFYQKVGN